MSFDLERLYRLLPAIYRIRDAELGDGRTGGPLRALLVPIAEQIGLVEESLEQLADDAFIETCAEWVVPYIGDLLGVRGLRPLPGAALSQRSFVAGTIGFRRRKGTVAVLEQLARAVTGWDARAVEFFERLVTTQSLHHVRPGGLATPSLRRQEPLDRLGSAFESLAHVADVRRIASRRGRYNLPNVGIFVWRLQAYPLSRTPAFRLDDRRFRFSPLGNDTPLFSAPARGDEIAGLVEPLDVPQPIRRRTLAAALDDGYYGDGLSLAVAVDGADVPDPSAEPPESPSTRVRVCDLGDLRDAAGAVVGWAHLPGEGEPIAIDPERGRLALPPRPGGPPPDVRVSFHYGFSADLGGGEYPRPIDPALARGPLQRVPTPHPTIQAALQALAAASRSGRYAETPRIERGPDDRVVVRAADQSRPLLLLEDELRIDGGDVTLSGLVIAGGTVVVGGATRRLRLEHCTLVPGLGLDGDGAPLRTDAPSLRVEVDPDEITTVEIDHCIVGRLRLPGAGARLTIRDSIVDGLGGVALAADDAGQRPGPPTSLERVTVFGATRVETLEVATDVIFDGAVVAARQQAGCVRFSYVPDGSQTPRRYLCQPDRAVRQALDAARKADPLAPPPAADLERIAAAVRGRLRPGFVSRSYGRPTYAQLDAGCPEEIRAGAEDGAEMGAFHDLLQPQREASLRDQLDEYVRFGLEVGILYAT